jgi:Domain of unknown function (DUF4136)
MRMSKSWILLPALLLACGPYKIRYDQDKQANIGNYKTYSWSQPKAEQAAKANELLERRVQSAVDAGLQAKNFVKAQGQADFLVAWYPVFREKAGSNFTFGFGVGGGSGPVSTGVSGSKTLPGNTKIEGSIVLQVMDAKSNLVVWQGTAEGDATGEGSPDQADARVSAAVRDLLAKLPNSAK